MSINIPPITVTTTNDTATRAHTHTHTHTHSRKRLSDTNDGSYGTRDRSTPGESIT